MRHAVLPLLLRKHGVTFHNENIYHDTGNFLLVGYN